MHTVKQYLWHWLTAVNDHSLQAPFIYDFFNKVLKAKTSNEDSLAIEALRQELIQSKLEIQVSSFGARSRVNAKRVRPVSSIARKGVTTAKTSQLLNRIIKVYDLKSIIELGTSFGLNSLYLALDPERSVITFEGCPNTLELARQIFRRLDYNNIITIEGNIDQTLPEYLLKQQEPIDFAFIDANHQFAPTLNYFNLLYEKSANHSVMVFDDIHWSAEMSRAWKTIVTDERVTLSIDLFDLGIVFFKPELEKQHYRIRY